jgi:hypothetical protein
VQLTRKHKTIVASAIVIPLAVLALYTWFVTAWTYSTGERAGYVQKFSKKGWLCKTWEGELAMVTIPGTMSEKFFFTVRNDSIAALVNKSLGKRVALTYHQHVGVPTSCFGDTEYYVSGVQIVE